MSSETVINTINELLKNKKHIVVAIDGRCGAGKTTVSERLKSELSCNLIHTDDFFLPDDKKTEERLLETGGNIDYERFYDEVIVPLKNGETFAFMPYSCSLKALTEPIVIAPKPVAIIEGSYSLHPFFGDYADLKIFIDISEKEQEKRLKARNIHLFERFKNEWIPMEERYFNEFKIKEKCDLILD